MEISFWYKGNLIYEYFGRPVQTQFIVGQRNPRDTEKTSVSHAIYLGHSNRMHMTLITVGKTNL